MVTDNKKEASNTDSSPVYSRYFIRQLHSSKEDNNQDVLYDWWDGDGRGGPAEHGGGQLGLTLVSRQQEGGSLHLVLWCLHYIIISS